MFAIRAAHPRGAQWTYGAARKGIVAVTAVPHPGELSHSKVPSSRSTRSRLLIKPRSPDFPIWLGASQRHHRTRRDYRDRWTG